MHRKTLASGITILFLLTIISPLTMGLNGEEIGYEDDSLDFIEYVHTSPEDIDGSEVSSKLDYVFTAPEVINPNFNIACEKSIPPFQTLSEISSQNKYDLVQTTTGPINSSWPMFCHDNHHTGLSPYNTAQNPGVEKWRFYTDGSIDGGIAIDTDGTLYFGDFGGRLYALFPNGTLKWKKDAMGLITTSTPCITEDGYIYIAGHSQLQKWDRNGTRIWSTGIGGNSASAPAVAEDGTIYIGSSSYNVLAFYPNGTRKWSFPTGYYVTSDAAIADDGTIIFGSGDTWIYALYPNGTLRWKFKTGHVVKGSASIDENGIIYMASGDDHLYAFFPNGTLKWKSNLGYGSETNPSFGPDGTVYYSYNGLWAVDPSDGSIKWKYDYPGQDEKAYLSSPAISADGIIYIGVDVTDEPLGAIYAINPDGTLRWREYIADQGLYSSPAIAEDGTVYIGSWWLHGGSVHAFNEWTGTNHPPEKPTYKIWLRPYLGSPIDIDFTSIDPDLHPLKIVVDWDDLSFIEESPEIASSYPINFEHEFPPRPFKTFNVRAKAVDSFRAESDWTVIPISLPVSYHYPALQWLLERFPLLSQLLELLTLLQN